MSDTSSNTKTVFYAKSWYLYVAAVVFTMLALFCSILGPLFLFDIIKRADAKPGTDAGIAISVMAIPMVLAALLSWFHVYARFKPLLRICEEGLEINVIGASSLDGVPLIPHLVRVAWLVLSLQGFRKQICWIPWELFRTIEVTGLPMMRSLVIDATVVYQKFRGDEQTAEMGNSVTFRDAELKETLDVVAATIQTFYDDPDARSILPSLNDK
ncbi:MAG: hypothetical protein MK179_21195 [Pirellulaceae bacterium]|nr:hypothetical protein [Pirellulaceae bacterium]